MVAKLKHPLGLAPDYVKIGTEQTVVANVQQPKKAKKQKGPNRSRVHSDQLLARKYGEANSYFYPYTSPKRARAFMILGKGDKERGYLRYLTLKRDTLKSLSSLLKQLGQIGIMGPLASS